MFDAHNDSTDDFSIALAFAGVLAPDLRPEDLRPVKNFALLGPINLNFM